MRVLHEAFDLVKHLYRARDFSFKTFGPPALVDPHLGVLDHIRKEVEEIAIAGTRELRRDEWIDVTILALDGLLRDGWSPREIAAALAAKQTKNEGRTWPDWRTAEPGKAIEHVREPGIDTNRGATWPVIAGNEGSRLTKDLKQEPNPNYEP